MAWPIFYQRICTASTLVHSRKLVWLKSLHAFEVEGLDDFYR